MKAAEFRESEDHRNRERLKRRDEQARDNARPKRAEDRARDLDGVNTALSRFGSK